FSRDWSSDVCSSDLDPIGQYNACRPCQQSQVVFPGRMLAKQQTASAYQSGKKNGQGQVKGNISRSRIEAKQSEESCSGAHSDAVHTYFQVDVGQQADRRCQENTHCENHEIMRRARQAA